MSPSTRWALAFVAGFVDTATFVHLSGLFAAHVTGNFVVFAAALSRGVEAADYAKLGTFPVFVFAVLLGTILHGSKDEQQPKKWVRLLALEAVLLLVSGAAAAACVQVFGSIDLDFVDLLVAFTLVVAMGLQNGVHRQTPGPMSTVMTGNVTAFTTMIGQWLFRRLRPSSPVAPTAGNPTALIVAFAVGCVAAAISTKQFGLQTVFVPGLLVAALAIKERA